MIKLRTKKLIFILPSILAILLIAGFVYAEVCDPTPKIPAPTNLTYLYQQDKADPTIVYTTLNWDIPDDFVVSDELDRPFPSEPLSQAGFKIDCQFAGETKPTTALIAPPTDTESEFHQGGAFQFPVKANTSGWCEVRSTNTAGELSNPTKVNINTDLPQITNIVIKNQNISYQTKTATTSNIFYHSSNSLITAEKTNLQTADYTPNTSISMEVDTALASSHSLDLKPATAGKYYTFITATDKYGNTTMSNIFSVDVVIQSAIIKGKVIDANGNTLLTYPDASGNIQGAQITITTKGKSVSSDSSGLYQITDINLTSGVTQESVDVTASYTNPNYEPCTSQTRAVTIKSGQTTSPVDFQFNCRFKIAYGKIIDKETGLPIANATVTVDKPQPSTATSNAQGIFTIPCNPSTGGCPANSSSFTLTASEPTNHNSQSVIIAWGGWAVETNIGLTPKTTRSVTNLAPTITKLTYTKSSIVMTFYFRAQDKEDPANKIEYSFKIDNDSWSSWSVTPLADYMVTKSLSSLRQDPTIISVRAKDSAGLESTVQWLKIRKNW